MAQRPRLSAPRRSREDWPWHRVQATSLSAKALQKGDRRFEGHAYLASGYGLRLAFAERPSGWETLAQFAHSSMPNRLKGNVAAPGFGRPYLAATQAFDLRPTPRKFLVVSDELKDELSVVSGQILVTRSGTVGRTTLAHRLHENCILSDDLLRVVPHQAQHQGWVYAYLRCRTAKEMMRSAHYGHMIKHLEPHHLDALPIPRISDAKSSYFSERVANMLALRNRSYDRLIEAERMFEAATGANGEQQPARPSFTVKARTAFVGRRRLEASYYSPEVERILARFRAAGLVTEPLQKLVHNVWWGARFKRFFGDGGQPYFSADNLWNLNPSAEKHILLDYAQAADPKRYMVEPGWLIMACSGQVYGLNGSVDQVTEKLATSFLSHDLIRIAPLEGVSSGYLLTALGHPTLGRPLVIRNAYGSSIPHLDPEDVAQIPIVRLGANAEQEIGRVADEAVQLRLQADDLENAITKEAQEIATDFLARSACAA